MNGTPSGEGPREDRLYAGITIQVADMETYRETIKLLASIPGVRVIFKTCGTEYPRIEIAIPHVPEAA